MNPAYKLLRDLGMRPAIARHFITQLCESGFVLVRADEQEQMKRVNEQIEIIIKLMKAKPRRRK